MMKQCIVTSEELEQIDFTTTVIFGFYTGGKESYFTDTCLTLMHRFPESDIIGCSSESNIYNHMPHVCDSTEDLCIFLCLDIQKGAYYIDLYQTKEIPKSLKEYEGKYGGLMFCSRYFENLEKVIYDLQSSKNVKPLFGAIAGVSEKSKRESGFVFWNGTYYPDHILLWLVDQDRYLLEGKSSHHFQPVGFDLEVTRAEGTILHEIENRPAHEVLEEIVGKITKETIASFDHPFFLKENAKIPFKHSPLCSIRAVDKKHGSIYLYRSVQERYKLKVGVSLGREEQEKQLAEFATLRKKRNAVAFLFNCVGIKANLGSMEFVYLMDLKKRLHMPIIGFHSFGEIGTTNQEHYSMLHNQTISIAVLSERSKHAVDK